MEEGAQIRPPGFVVVTLPYADDIRDIELPSAAADPEAVKAAVPKAKKLISRLTVDFDCDQFEDPVCVLDCHGLQRLPFCHADVFGSVSAELR